MRTLELAYSPCPNDTYIFHAWVHGLLPDAPPVSERLADIDELNRLAARGEAEVAKVSFHAVGHLRDRYALLHAGGALGRGCGPLVVAAGALTGLDRPDLFLRDARILVPGAWTTAALLLRLYAPDHATADVVPYDEIMPAVSRGDADAGLIIHESRFTYEERGLESIVDLGAWWEERTGRPIPLGGIVIRRDLIRDLAAETDGAIRASLDHARNDPDASRAYVRRHAQEMDPDVCRRHIGLYVTEFSRDYGQEGRAAIEDLMARGVMAGAFQDSEEPLFWDDAPGGGS